MTSQTAAIPSSLFLAAKGAEERWVKEQVAQLGCLEPADRPLLTAALKAAGTRAAADWTTSFAARMAGFAFWSGVVFASVIGAALWTVRIPSRGSPAATAAAAYLVIAVVAIPACRIQARRVLDQFRRRSTKAARDFLALYLAIMTCGAILYGAANATAFSAAAHRHVSALFYLDEFGAFAAVTAVGFVLAYLVSAYAYASAFRDGGTNQALNWAGPLAATALTSWIPVTGRSPATAGNRRLDSGLLGLLGCAATIDRLGHGECLAAAQTVRSLILTLETAAADIEQYAVDRVPRFDTSTRRLAHQHGITAASVAREAKLAVARAVNPHDYQDAAATLAGFLLAWARPERHDAGVAAGRDPGTEQAPLWRRVIRRFWNAVLLAAAGIGLPLLPIYNSDHAAAAGLRYALLTAAVLAMATGGGATSDTIQRNLESTLPGAPGHPH